MLMLSTIIVLMAYALHLKGLRLTRFKTQKAVDFIGINGFLRYITFFFKL